jgi:hypothetical protein
VNVTVERKDIRGVANAGAEAALLSALATIHADTVPNCANDKGQLRNSYMWKTHNEEGGLNSQPGENADHVLDINPREGEGYVGTGSDHWYSEFGTRYQIAQPALRPAGEKYKGSSAKQVAAKYCRDKMLNEFMKRKYLRLLNG